MDDNESPVWPRFLFLRHGETDWNLEGRYQGHTDIVLNETGIAQAERAADRLAHEKIDRIVTSPLLRALKTAAIVAQHKSSPIYIDAALRERAFGSFEGLVVNDVKRAHGLPLHERSRSILPDDAEQWTDTVQRVHAAVAEWLQTHPRETLLFVAHDGISRALAETLLQDTLASKHATPYAFEPTGNGRWQGGGTLMRA